MLRSQVRSFFLCLLFLLVTACAASSAETGWTLWKGNGIAGVVNARSSAGADRIGLKRMAEVLDCPAFVKGDRLVVVSGKKFVEFVLGAAAARTESGQIIPLAAAVKAEDGEWWAEPRGALRLFEALLSTPQLTVRLRFAGTGPLPEKDTQPAETPAAPVVQPQAQPQTVYGPLPQLEGIRWSRTGEKIRAVLDLSAAVEPDIKLFPGIAELTLAAASSRNIRGVPSPYGTNLSVAITQFGDKIVVRFNHRADSVKTFPLHKPERLVLDFLAKGTTEEASPQETPSPAGATGGAQVTAAAPPSMTPAFSGKRQDGKPFLVAVDAGHGGHDPGAVSGGFNEKDLNLKAAAVLVARLKEAGLDARLTRRDDTYLKLSERTALANGWNADLFVSLHCNALPKGRHARGTEIYLMALPTDKDAMRLALVENRELGNNNTVQDADAKTNLLLKILGDMEQNAKISQSTSLAESLFNTGRSLGLPMSRVAQAPFFVLRGAAMPAVLVEMGYLTEPEDRRLLNDPAFVDRLMRSLVSGMSSYLKTLSR